MMVIFFIDRETDIVTCSLMKGVLFVISWVLVFLKSRLRSSVTLPSALCWYRWTKVGRRRRNYNLLSLDMNFCKVEVVQNLTTFFPVKFADINRRRRTFSDKNFTFQKERLREFTSSMSEVVPNFPPSPASLQPFLSRVLSQSFSLLNFLFWSYLCLLAFSVAASLSNSSLLESTHYLFA
jgi:hypothetical protein